ncbi:MAG: hypothetical protein H0W83_04795 [Planctomycetes bacterium]|nr:hypothetical protein [Planctomycetota bacterium]
MAPDDADGLVDGTIYVQAQNTAATTVPGAGFSLLNHQGASIDYVLTRGAGVVRKGRMEIAGDSAAPSVADSGTSVGVPGITWSVVVSGNAVSVQLAVDNVIASAVRIRFRVSRLKVP